MNLEGTALCKTFMVGVACHGIVTIGTQIPQKSLVTAAPAALYILKKARLTLGNGTNLHSPVQSLLCMKRADFKGYGLKMSRIQKKS